MGAMKVIGLISGTSVDGIDAALVDISGTPPEGVFSLIRYETYPYPKGVSERLIRLSTDGTVAEMCHMNFYLGELFAEAAIRLSKGAGTRIEHVDLIGSHGQTIRHHPEPRRDRGRKIRSTLQIGEPSIIAQRTGVATVADFRPRDIAAGGNGAPLTPGLHYVLFRHPLRSRLVVNIGGISNLTFIPAGRKPDSVIAFDTGPGNMLIDGIVRVKTRGRHPMDRGGRLAGRGRVHAGLLAELMRHPFLRARPPKTTGREAFGADRIRGILKRSGTIGLSTPDLVATVTRFTARTIADGYRRFVSPFGKADDVVVGGGGALNPVLMRFLEEEFSPAKVGVFEDYRLDSKAVEAMAFALLAYETVLGIPNNFPSATGAEEKAVLGKIIPGRRGMPGGATSLLFPGIPASPDP